MTDNKESASTDTPVFAKAWQELKRRKVVRVAMVYLVTGWIIIQVASTMFEGFGIPDWAFRFVSLMVLLGLPVALILAWAFELTPEGIRKTESITEAETSDGESGARKSQRNWPAYALGAVALVFVISTVVLFNKQPGSSATDQTAGADTAEVDSIAVMPLVNMSALEENAFFAGGIHEDILTNLSRIENLEVISRTSMLRYASSDLTLKEIGDELGVEFIVEGSVRRLGNHVRVTIQLINARTDLHLWANNFERELVDEFATQSALALEISNSIHLELQPESVVVLEGMPTTSVKAYDLYIRAQSLEKTAGETQENVTLMQEMLEEAVSVDPDFVEAWGGLKRLYDLMADRAKRRGWYVDQGEDKLRVSERLKNRSQRALEKAVALDPENVETLLARAVDHDWPKSAEEMQENKALLDRIIETYPENAKAWYHLGFWHSHRRDFPDHDMDALRKDALSAFNEALSRDPFNARMVTAVLDWARGNGSQETVTRLADRLNQIIPETASERHLARISWGFRREQIVAALLETADESLVEDYEQALLETIEIDGFSFAQGRNLGEMELRVFQNDLDRLHEVLKRPVDPGAGRLSTMAFSISKVSAMNLYLKQGKMEEARRVAESVLEHEELILAAASFRQCGCILSSLTTAHYVLGNKEEALWWAEKHLKEKGASDEWAVTALAYLDLERAVEIMFGEMAMSGSSVVFDEIALYHTKSNHLITHPRVMQYYIDEGKWLEYLSKRVPEYAPE